VTRNADALVVVALSSTGQLRNKTHTRVMKMNRGDFVVASASGE
jgi:hypothetical protein